MKVKWNGHASFTITSDNGTRITTDPYEPGGFDGALAYGPIPDEPDIVVISHEHADHNHLEGLKGNPEVVKSAGTYKGIEFKMVPVKHDRAGGSERGDNNIFIFTVDGVTLCHLGDLGHTLSDDEIRSIGKVDVLFIPVGGYFTIDPNEATSVIKQLDARLVIPMHFKTEKCNFPISQIDDFIHGKEDITEKLAESEVEITRDKIPGNVGIWVLTHAC